MTHLGMHMRLLRSMLLLALGSATACDANRAVIVDNYQPPANCTSNTMPTPAVSPVQATVSVGDTIRFLATLTPACDSRNTPSGFRWTTSNADRMTVESATGLATAHDTGTVAISAVVAWDAMVTGAATVIIHP